MKKILSLITAIYMAFSLVGCGNQNAGSNNQSMENTNAATKVEKATTGGSDIATRVIENGTAITLTIGDTVIPATLNNSTSSKELISRLPYTVHLNKFAHDYCGVMKEPLKYDEVDVHNGWMNGDIDFARDANYFTILYEDEETSKQFGDQINLGKIDNDLSVIKGLGGSIDILIQLEPTENNNK